MGHAAYARILFLGGWGYKEEQNVNIPKREQNGNEPVMRTKREQNSVPEKKGTKREQLRVL